MKTSSCKAKGRGLQQEIRDMYRKLGESCGLVEGDIESRGMGQAGVDLILSPKARNVFNHDIECKRHKSVSVPKHFEEHYEKYKDASTLKLLFHKNDRSETLVTLRAEDFMNLLKIIVNTNEAIAACEEDYRSI